MNKIEAINKLENMGKYFLKSVLSAMEELKDHEDREQFCHNFDEEYEKIKEIVAEYEEEGANDK